MGNVMSEFRKSYARQGGVEGLVKHGVTLMCLYACMCVICVAVERRASQSSQDTAKLWKKNVLQLKLCYCYYCVPARAGKSKQGRAAVAGPLTDRR